MSSWNSPCVLNQRPSKTFGAFCSRQLQAACTLLDKCIQVCLQVLLWEVTSRWNRFVFDCHVCGFVWMQLPYSALLHFGISNSLSAFQTSKGHCRMWSKLACEEKIWLQTSDFSRYSPSFVDTWYGAYHGMFASAGGEVWLPSHYHLEKHQATYCFIIIFHLKIS